MMKRRSAYVLRAGDFAHLEKVSASMVAGLAQVTHLAGEKFEEWPSERLEYFAYDQSAEFGERPTDRESAEYLRIIIRVVTVLQ